MTQTKLFYNSFSLLENVFFLSFFLRFPLTAISILILDQKLNIFATNYLMKFKLLNDHKFSIVFPLKSSTLSDNFLKFFLYFPLIISAIVVETLLSSLEWALVDRKFSPLSCLPMRSVCQSLTIILL